MRGAALAFALLASAPGCGREPASEAPPLASAPAPKPPADQALPGELAEGKELAFGLPVPRRMRVTRRFPDAVFARGNVPAADVVRYVKARVGPSVLEEGEGKTTFVKTHHPSAPSRPLRIDVVSRYGTTELVVRDETPPKAPSLSQEEMYRRHGLNPRGELLDPNSIE